MACNSLIVPCVCKEARQGARPQGCGTCNGKVRMHEYTSGLSVH